MDLTKTRISVLVLLLGHGGLGLAAEAPSNKSIAVIKPGVGIGNVRLGDGLPDVIRKMGRKPSDGRTVQFGRSTEYWLDYKDQGITLIFDERQLLKRIAVTNAAITVERKGLRTELPTGEVNKVYGKGKVKDLGPTYEQRIFEKEGISFTVNKARDRVETITVERPK